MYKQSSMYQDPRNFILEKLQRDTSLSMAEKADLAGRIRSMSMAQASDLERSVRSALGIGVGALIANYFGLGSVGMLLGGVAGAAAFNAMGFGGDALARMTRTPNFGVVFDQDPTGFSTYNEYLKSIYR